MQKILETSRLHLREMTAEDAESVYLLNLDPDVIQYTGDKAFLDIEEARNFLLNYDHYKKYGYGRWAVIVTESNEFIGWCGLKYLVDSNEIDLGYRFLKKHWGNGYATESANVCLNFGFNKLNMQTIIGRAMVENIASINVLQKTGMKFEKTFLENGLETVFYRINKKDLLPK